MNSSQAWRERVSAAHQALLDWYRKRGRDLPWRRTRDPYAILVSEIMLQQTQVERVRGKYVEFLDAFPTFPALASASLSEVIRRWAPLGYNRRAVRLHRIAQHVVWSLDGRLPDTVEGLRLLEGLGSYTANAVACFAFEREVAVVDTNVRRVLSRIFAEVVGPEPLTPRAMEGLAHSVLASGRAYDWNQALMDLGATVCVARAPRCGECPVAFVCAGRDGLAEATPAPRRAAEPRAEYTVAEPFQESDRYYRGRIVDRLRGLADGESLDLDQLGHSVRDDYQPRHSAWLAALVAALERDGLLTRTVDGRVSLP